MKHILGVLGLVLAVATAHAQSVSVLAPSDRFVRPGETLALTFELASPEAVEVGLEASTPSGWAVSVEPTRLALEPDIAATISVTVDVPPDAPAITNERVTLRVFGIDPPVESTVDLNVLEVIDLQLDAPTQAPLGEAGLRFAVVNAGNSTRSVTVELRREEAILATRELVVEAGERAALTFDLTDEGDHVLLLRSPRAPDVQRTVRAIRFGTPEPAPFRLAGSLTGSYGLGGEWDAAFSVRGRLSDFSSIDVRAAAPNWRRSYAAVSLEYASVRIGAGGAAPFRLDLPRDLGLAASYERDGIGLGGMFGVTANDELSGYVAASWTAPDYSIAAGGGLRAEAPVAAVSAGYTTTGLVMALSGKYQDEKFGVRLTATIREEQTTTNLRVEARDILTDRSRLDLEARFRTGPTAVYGNVTAPLAERAVWAWRTGLTQDLTVDFPGSLQLALQVGSSESFARVSHRVTIAEEWRTTNVLGVRYDTKGFGLTLDSGWAYLAIDDLSLSTRLTYYPSSGTVDGQVRAKLQVVEDPVSLALDGNWNLTGRTLGASVALGLFEGPWSFDIDGSARYAYTRETDPWTFDVGVSLSYAFDMPVSDAVVEGTGGRRLGTLVGTVIAAGRPVAGVVVSVGRFRAITDDLGTFELQLPPGTYRVSVDRTTAPAGYRVREPDQLSVVVELRATEEVEFVLVRTAP